MLDQLPVIIIILAWVFFFILAILMPLFVMLIYFELKNIRRIIHKATTNPEEERRIKELQQKFRKRR